MEERPTRFRFDSFTFFFGFGFGSFLGVALALLAIALVQRSDASDPGIQAIVLPTPPPTRVGTTATPDTRAKTKTASDVYLGPSDAYAIVGTMARGEAVEIVGRDSSSEWVAVRFPPGSSARGWLPVSGLDNASSIERFAIVLPTQLPGIFVLPTPIFASARPGLSAGTGSSGGSGGSGGPRPPLSSEPEVATPTSVPVPLGPPDLVVNRISLEANGAVRVTVANRGPGPLLQQVNVLVRDRADKQDTLTVARLGVGETISLTTSSALIVTADSQITALVDPYGSTTDHDRSNNAMTVSLSPEAPPAPTPTPRRRDE